MQDSPARPVTPVAVRLARVVSAVCSPILLVPLLLLSLPWRTAAVTWPQAVVATCFTVLLPTAVLALATRRGTVTDIHVRERHQRHWVYAMAAALILAGLVVLWFMKAQAPVFTELLTVLTGLVLVAVINVWWKVSVHAAVGCFTALQLAGSQAELMPAVVALTAVIGWARVRTGRHTASQVCGGVLVGVAIYYAGLLLGTLLG